MLAHRVNKSEKDPCIACTRNVMCFISSHMITFDVSNVVILLVMLTGVEFIRWIRIFFLSSLVHNVSLHPKVIKNKAHNFHVLLYPECAIH